MRILKIQTICYNYHVSAGGEDYYKDYPRVEVGKRGVVSIQITSERRTGSNSEAVIEYNDGSRLTVSDINQIVEVVEE